jgi:cytochrome P450
VVDDELAGIQLPVGTQVVILNSFTHRDEQIDKNADHFSPEIWLSGQTHDAFNHLSNGPQACAGKELALFIAKSVLSTLLEANSYTLTTPTLPAHGPIPQTFNPFVAQFQLQL